MLPVHEGKPVVECSSSTMDALSFDLRVHEVRVHVAISRFYCPAICLNPYGGLSCDSFSQAFVSEGRVFFHPARLSPAIVRKGASEVAFQGFIETGGRGPNSVIFL